MNYPIEEFRTRCSEQCWLDRLRDVQFGGGELSCPGCKRSSTFTAAVKQRAFVCQACGHRLLPLAGTPLDKSQRVLPDWLYALELLHASRGAADAKELQDKIGCDYKTAWRMEQELRRFMAAPNGTEAVSRWLRALDACLKDANLPAHSANPKQHSSSPPATLSRGDGPLIARAPRMSSRTRWHIAVFGSLIGGTVAAMFLAAMLSDHSGRIDGVPATTLAAPPSLTIAMLRSSVRISPAIDDASLDSDRLLGEPEPAYVEDRASYTLAIQEATAAGPRDPDHIVAFGPVRVRRHIVETIVAAARKTKADPVLLMAVADKESSFSTTAKARTSSATGLFQFIDKTWLRVVRDFGPAHGLEKEANAITLDGDELTVKDSAAKERILELRRDPYLSALLAAEMLKRDSGRISRRIGRDLTHGETYLAHFLGADGAGRFIENLTARPTLVAAELMPRPAKANRSIFFAQQERKSKGLSLAEVHKKFEAMMDLRADRYREVGSTAAPVAYAPTAAAEPMLILRVGRPKL